MARKILYTLFSLCGVTYATTLPSAETAQTANSCYLTVLEQTVCNKYPQTFTGSDKFEGFDLELLKSVFGPENALKHIKLQQLYLNIITQYAEQNLPSSETKTSLLAALHTAQTLGIDGFMTSSNKLLISRVLAAANKNELSDDERALFEEIPDSKIIFAHYQKVPNEIPSLSKTANGEDVDKLFNGQTRFAWQHSNQAIKYFFEQPETPGKEKDYDEQSFIIGEKGRQLLNKEFNKHFGENKAYWPMLNTAKIGLSLLVKVLLDDISLIPLPHKMTKAHGVDVTPLGMMFHDFFHSKLDKRRKIIYSWCADNINKRRGLDTSNKEVYSVMIPPIVQEASDRYKNVINQFRTVYNQALEGLNNVSDITLDQKKAYNRIIVPIYLIFHEAYVFNQNWLDTPEDSVKLATASAKNFFEKHFSQEIKYDLVSSDKDIIQSVIQTETLNRGNKIYKITDQIDKSQVLYEECSVRRNSMNIVVELVLNDGTELSYKYPTQNNIERDLQDYISLLKLCGYIEQFNIETSASLYPQRNNIKAAIIQLFDDFLKASN